MVRHCRACDDTSNSTRRSYFELPVGQCYNQKLLEQVDGDNYTLTFCVDDACSYGCYSYELTLGECTEYWTSTASVILTENECIGGYTSQEFAPTDLSIIQTPDSDTCDTTESDNVIVNNLGVIPTSCSFLGTFFYFGKAAYNTNGTLTLDLLCMDEQCENCLVPNATITLGECFNVFGNMQLVQTGSLATCSAASNSASSSSPMSSGAIAGSVIGAIVGAAVLVIVVLVYARTIPLRLRTTLNRYSTAGSSRSTVRARRTSRSRCSK